VEIGTETKIFLFWEYLFQIFGILSLQCIDLKCFFSFFNPLNEVQNSTAVTAQIYLTTNGLEVRHYFCSPNSYLNCINECGDYSWFGFEIGYALSKLEGEERGALAEFFHWTDCAANFLAF
jgi:hypothetical protein